jgi:hypothetical protein
MLGTYRSGDILTFVLEVSALKPEQSGSFEVLFGFPHLLWVNTSIQAQVVPSISLPFHCS